MPALRDIKRRINAVKNIQKITKAMKMVAAARLRRAQDRIVSARPYARKMSEVTKHLLTYADALKHPLLQRREVKNIALVVVTSDRGLCGSFNTNLIRAATKLIDELLKELPNEGKLKLICVGRKGYNYFVRRQNNFTIVSTHIGVFGKHIEYSWVKKITDELVGGFTKGEFDRVVIIYNEFKSVLHQRIVHEEFLPIVPETEVVRPRKGVKIPLVEYIYEPGVVEILNSIIPKHLETQIWRILLESNAAEQAARMTAMDNATENAAELIKHLQLSFNKARQAAITKEMIEIASGAEALKKAGVS